MTSVSFLTSLKRATIFVNPAAGNGRSVPVGAEVQKVFAEAFCPADLVTPPSASEMEAAVREAIASGSRLLIALGGDGTLQTLVNAAYGQDVVLGILPGGGGNDFAAALGLPADPLAAAKVLASGGEPRCIDLARARTADRHERLYVGGGGVGIDAEAARHAVGRWRRLPGRSRYIVAALQALCTYQPIAVQVEFSSGNQPPLETKALLAAALNTPSYGGGIRLAPEARLDDGLLDVVVVETAGLAEALTWIPELLRSGELRRARVRRMRASELKLVTSRECLFHGDGEILGPAPVEIEVLPRAARILVPGQAS